MSGNISNFQLDSALEEARSRFLKRNPKSADAHEKATRSMPGGNTRTSLFYAPFPLAIARGDGPYVWDADGHKYLDLLGEFTAGLYGHSHPVIREALNRALDNGLNFGGHGLIEAEFAEVLCRRFKSIDLIRFTNSGTEANLMAISTALAINKRRKVLVFNGGYHGGVFTFHSGHNRINAPFDFILGRYNDVAGTRQLIEDNALALGVVILEPMQGGAGCIPASADFLSMLREVTAQHGITMIFDEVMTSRLGVGGLQGEVGITPDMTTLGKYVGGGMSFGAFGGTEKIMRHLDPRQPDALPHAGTFNNNVLTMSAGLAAMTQIYTPAAVAELNLRGERLRGRLNALFAERNLAISFTGRGSMMNIHPTTASVENVEDTKRGRPEIRDLFFFEMLEKGFYCARRGMINLSLVITDEHADQFVAAIDEFATVHKGLLSAPA
ncbi:aminotransferase class III-fold pyridoxal phosphate-dependent enzyme [Pseudaminobacter sp. 19-2017]|uniref:Aminotransferase class III-fold pyridoxal phosphate-dependent enzyme n=1 Tax=Pseudaminobacter soli (ex Zhang et al. 2022) TaxID=2831468 RepID=A0A942IBG5_9HYPH|nr:aminotransferase class III-fold pyridoxal phosphate-dependent enzyme [Pseudaminobacter soli]MBS3651576.1 aminotransferase class III-fold pyridoxal phosphate-dependent enzyme [Pseudaminobacter soli]